MRIKDILTEGEYQPLAFLFENINTDVVELVQSVMVPLAAQKVEKISIKQILDIIQNQPALEHINIDDAQLIDVLKRMKNVYKIQADPENNGLMTAFLEIPQGERQVNAKTAEKEKKEINKAALRTIKDKQK